MMKNLILFTLAIVLFACKNDAKVSTAAETETKKVEETPKRNTIDKENMKISDIQIDFAGAYKGSIPCSDCDGVDISLEVTNDLTYNITGELKGKENGKFSKSGTYKINQYVIELDHDINQAKYFFIQPEGLFVLNENRQQIGGSNKDLYLITK